MNSKRLLTKKQIVEVFERFKAANSNPQSELVAPNPFCLLVSVVLSAQTTDKAVNKATEPLYKIANTPKQIYELGEEKLITYIKSIGLYRNKAKNVIELSRILWQDYDSMIPDTREELMKLPGVGRKTANVVLNVVFGQHTMPVDTHLLRICPKIGLADGSTPEEVEKSLVSRIPDEYMEHAHHWLILHGRYVCTAKIQKCDQCIINDICKARN